MSDHGPAMNNEPMSKDRQIFHLAQDIKIALEEAEARGYRRGVQDAVKTVGEALESPAEQRCCGFGIGAYGGPPECCNNPISLIDGGRTRDAILALLEQPEPGEKK